MLSAYLKRNSINTDGEKEKDLRAHYELRRCPIPTIKGMPPGTILVKSIATSICGSDLCGVGGYALTILNGEDLLFF